MFRNYNASNHQFRGGVSTLIILIINFKRVESGLPGRLVLKALAQPRVPGRMYSGGNHRTIEPRAVGDGPQPKPQPRCAVRSPGSESERTLFSVHAIDSGY